MTVRWNPVPTLLKVDLTSLSELITSIGTPNFDRFMLAALNAVAATDSVVGIVVSPTHSYPAGWCSRRADIAHQAELLASLFASDHRPPVLKPPSDFAIGAYYMAALKPAELREEERWSLFDKHGLKTGLLVARHTTSGWGVTAVLSQGAVAKVDLTSLAQHVALLGLLAHRHVFGTDTQHGLRPAAQVRLMRAIESRFPALSLREREVLTATMCGAKAEAIGAELGISTSTVMTYRRRAYARLGVSHAGEVLTEIV